MLIMIYLHKVFHLLLLVRPVVFRYLLLQNLVIQVCLDLYSLISIIVGIIFLIISSSGDADTYTFHWIFCDFINWSIHTIIDQPRCIFNLTLFLHLDLLSTSTDDNDTVFNSIFFRFPSVDQNSAVQGMFIL